MPPRPSPLRRLVLAGLWAAAAAVLVAIFALAAGGLAWAGLGLAGVEVGEVQQAVWLALARTIGATALAPLGLLAIVGWWLATSVRPALDGGWRSIAGGVALLAALGFPPVGAWCFTAWSPGGALDVLGTLVLLAGGVTVALLLARRILPPLRPGAFGEGPPEGA